MEPSELAAILAVLRDAGAVTAEVPTLINFQVHQLRVTFGPLPTVIVPGEEEPEADEDLPPGAYDPIAARKKAP